MSLLFSDSSKDATSMTKFSMLLKLLFKHSRKMQSPIEKQTNKQNNSKVFMVMPKRPTFVKTVRKKKSSSENLSDILVFTSTLNSHYSGRHKALRSSGVLLLLLLFKTFIFLSHENWCCLATQGLHS